MKKSIIYLIALTFLYLIGCNINPDEGLSPEGEPGAPPPPFSQGDELFTFAMTGEISVNLSVTGRYKMLAGHTRVELFAYSAEEGQPGEMVGGGFMNENGRFQTTLVLPTYLKEVYIILYMLGIDNEAIVKIEKAEYHTSLTPLKAIPKRVVTREITATRPRTLVTQQTITTSAPGTITAFPTTSSLVVIQSLSLYWQILTPPSRNTGRSPNIIPSTSRTI